LRREAAGSTRGTSCERTTTTTGQARCYQCRSGIELREADELVEIIRAPMKILFALAAAVIVAVALGLEVRLFAPQRVPRRREAIVWASGWLLFSLAVAAGIALADGPAGEWTTVYLIERSLSLDNVFLFSLLLGYFLVPPELRGRAIAIGIAGALLLRALAISVGVALVDAVDSVLYVFGALLLYVAYRTLRSSPETSDPSSTRAVRLVRRAVPFTDEFRGSRLLVREQDRLYGTPLLLVVAAIVVADIAFAIDSIPAAFAVTRDAVLIWTANAFALLGLASLLALIDLLVRRFRYVDETIALVLAFVGTKILLADVVHLGDLATLAVIAAFLAAGIGASLVADRLDPPHPAAEAVRRPPRCPPQLTSNP
jgi:tellurite resistance protein TerC